MKRFLLVLAGVFIILPIFARDFYYEYEGQKLMYTVLSIEDRTVATYPGFYLTPGNWTKGDLILPEIVYDESNVPYTLIVISERSFNNCSDLTSITIPNSVTSIGEAAFQNCTGLTSVTIGNSVTSIGYAAFQDCSGLESVTIGNSVTSIRSYAFSGCSGLKKAEFASVEALCKIEFSIALSNPLAYAHNLYINGEKIKDLVIPETVESIGSYALYNCTGLTSVSIPNSVESIGYAAFLGCSGLSSVSIPNSVTSIGDSAFQDCTGLTSVSIPNSVMSIGSYAFYGCSGLTSVTIPNSVTSIGSYAFASCYGLTSVTIPNSVTSIGYDAFYRCSGLTSVTIPNSVTSIGSYAFASCYGLTSVTIPNSVTSIGWAVFKDCSGLTSVTIPNSVKSIGESAFQNCTGLTSVTIPNSVTSIGESAFQNCTGLTSVTIGNSVEHIRKKAFNECKALTEIVIPPSVISIGFKAFANDSSLTNIILGSQYLSISGWVFYGCPAHNVRITAQRPPRLLYQDVFSNYGCLWVQGEEACNAYKEATPYWNSFSEYRTMVEPTGFKYEGETELSVKPGDTFKIDVTLMPENVTLPQVFWRSNNPEFATVDVNGVVTVHKGATGNDTRADDEEVGTCEIIAESLYADGPILKVKLTDQTASAETIFNDMTDGADSIDWNSPVEIYNLNGRKMRAAREELAPGIYIARQGSKTEKFIKN